MIGLLELSILLFIVFLILGPKRIINLLRAMGRGVQDFTKEMGRKIDGKELPEKKDPAPKRKD